MSKNYVEIICIIDRSGSMSSVRDDAIGGYNAFLESQKKIKEDANLTLVLFDHEYLMPYTGDIKTAPKLSSAGSGDDYVHYCPRGNTALYDAVGRAITSVGERLSKLTEDGKPKGVMVVILTDGFENWSSEYSFDKIKEMINHQKEKYSWEFLFLSSDIKSFDMAKNGLSISNAVSFAASSIGTRSAFDSIDSEVKQYRHIYTSPVEDKN